MKVFVMESKRNVAVAINSNPRKNFSEGDRVVVSKQEARSLLQLGFSILGEVEITPDILTASNGSELSNEVCKTCEHKPTHRKKSK